MHVHVCVHACICVQDRAADLCLIIKACDSGPCCLKVETTASGTNRKCGFTLWGLRGEAMSSTSVRQSYLSLPNQTLISQGVIFGLTQKQLKAL